MIDYDTSLSDTRHFEDDGNGFGGFFFQEVVISPFESLVRVDYGVEGS